MSGVLSVFKDGKKIVISMVEKVYQLGTPSHLKSYLDGEQWI